MHLVQLLLPTFDNRGVPYAAEHFEQVENELTERFGGVTVYTRAPANGTWRESATSNVRDQLLLFEVMCESLDRGWWRQYREELELQFEQSEIVARSFAIHRL